MHLVADEEPARIKIVIIRSLSAKTPALFFEPSDMESFRCGSPRNSPHFQSRRFGTAMPLHSAALSALPREETNQKKKFGSNSSLCELTMRAELDDRHGVDAQDRTNLTDLNTLDEGPPKKKRAGLIAWKDLRNTRYISEGAFCSVHSAQLEGKMVAVKLLKTEHEGDEVAITDVEMEAELLKEMSHEHVLKMIGHGRHLTRPFIVMERLECTLSDKLKSTQAGFFFLQSKRTQLSLPVSLDYAKQLAKAMVYLHHEAFPGYHLLLRDLKPDNIGITCDGRLVLIDFGLSKLIPASPTEDVEDFKPEVLTGKTGSARYMAPEVALSKPYNIKAEVYSFSMILYEMVAHQKHFAEMDLATLFSEVFISGLRPPLLRKWPTELRVLLTECWSRHPKCRPNFCTVLGRVEELLSALPK
ncbi:hypothetical protein AB1Y20_012534 [Prymnesium parvum]|uniref:Protein kinase domain-containing protein n=1 Tax=Prymnesium parvum TaxID=97485 RepID=A0AB34IKK7_PRYPA